MFIRNDSNKLLWIATFYGVYLFRMKGVTRFLLETVQVVVFSISIFLFIYFLVLQPHKIRGASMEPNFHENEYLLTDKVSYRFGEPSRGDVVVFKASTGQDFIKRIIALPGEEIEIRNNTIFVNGVAISEEYIPENFQTATGQFLAQNQPIIVPDDYYFVLGDNRSHSLDSRTFGFVNRGDISGKAFFVYWPPADVGVIEAAEYSLN